MSIAIGDIHGCLEPLERLIRRLPQGEKLIFLGDYIDRGKNSAEVVSFLKNLAEERPCRFLKGNHEDLMLKAIENNDQIFYWISNGGRATLKSYGEELAVWRKSPDKKAFLQNDLEFFENLEPYAEEEDFIYVHAGIDLALPEMARQSPKVLFWVREKFFRNSSQWKGKKIVFGHTPTYQMGIGDSKIFRSNNFFGIDTGCVYGGALTALDTNRETIYQEFSDFSCR